MDCISNVYWLRKSAREAGGYGDTLAEEKTFYMREAARESIGATQMQVLTWKREEDGEGMSFIPKRVINKISAKNVKMWCFWRWRTQCIGHYVPVLYVTCVMSLSDNVYGRNACNWVIGLLAHSERRISPSAQDLKKTRPHLDDSNRVIGKSCGLDFGAGLSGLYSQYCQCRQT